MHPVGIGSGPTPAREEIRFGVHTGAGVGDGEESASHCGIAPVEMARASITGQPVHLQSPLVPAILLLVSLANVNLGDHHKKVLWRAALVSLAMLAVGVLVGVIPLAA